MKISDIYSLLEHKYSINDFIINYKNEFEKYSKLLSKKGSTVPINVEEDFEFIFQEQHLIAISEFYLSNILSEIEINYLADCILLSENIQIIDEELHELLETFTDSEINGHLTADYVIKVVKTIKKEKK